MGTALLRESPASQHDVDVPSLAQAEAVRPREERLILLGGVAIGAAIGFFFLVYIVLAISVGEERNFAPHALDPRLPLAVARVIIGV